MTKGIHRRHTPHPGPKSKPLMAASLSGKQIVTFPQQNDAASDWSAGGTDDRRPRLSRAC